ncbi:uncharacterized protein [Struthio camelus]|uniref:uncharacterized protein isoform X5 n=1 Tax=Struthio camelus TaxID=8801 RepID=UPI003603DBC4
MTTAAGEAEALHCMSSNKDQRLRLLMSQELRKKAEQAQLSQSFFRGEMLQSPHHLCSPPLDSLQERHVSLVLGSPELDTVLEESVLAGCLHDPLPQQVSQPHQHCKDLLGYLQELNPSSIKEINPANARNKLFSTKSTSRDKFLSVREKV